MIDRSARDSLARLLAAFLAGEMTIASLQQSAPQSRDLVVREIVAQAWLLRDEGPAAEPKTRFTREDRGEISRWILFLKSDLPYRWPTLPTWARIAGFVPSVLTFGLFWYPYRRWFETRGDHRAWPFLSEDDLKKARNTPKRPASD
jgi:hypothetical protein